MRSESEGERALGAVVKGIEREPEWGISDLVPGRRLDLGWRLALFGLEYDGRDHHVLPTNRDADGVRDLESLVSGVAILRVTAGMSREQPERTRALIEAILHRRLGRWPHSATPACSRRPQLGVRGPNSAQMRDPDACSTCSIPL